MPLVVFLFLPCSFAVYNSHHQAFVFLFIVPSPLHLFYSHVMFTPNKSLFPVLLYLFYIYALLPSTHVHQQDYFFGKHVHFTIAAMHVPLIDVMATGFFIAITCRLNPLPRNPKQTMSVRQNIASTHLTLFTVT